MISNYTLKPIGTKPTTTDFPVLSVTKVTPEVGTEVQVGVERFYIIEEFATHYTNRIEDALEELRMKLHLFYSDVFSANVTEIARPEASRLREQMKEEENKAVELVESFIKHAAQYNQDPDLVYTCNEHYLSSLIADMMEADDRMSTDSGSTRHIYHNVRALSKTRRRTSLRLHRRNCNA
jgi:hypothetical protein